MSSRQRLPATPRYYDSETWIMRAERSRKPVRQICRSHFWLAFTRAGYFRLLLDGTFEFRDPAARYASRPFFLSAFPDIIARLLDSSGEIALRVCAASDWTRVSGLFRGASLRTPPIVSGHMRGTIQPVCRFTRVFEPVTITFLGMRAEKVI